MGHKLDLSGLTELEAEHVLQVVQRDMMLRKKEEQRLSDLRRELEEEGSRRRLLLRQARFNQLCCIRCCLPFHFLLRPRRCCGDCLLNVCRACRAYCQADRAWLCSTCRKRRLLKTQSLEWFYENVKRRFKRFGSAKVLKTLYRKHLANRGALAELTEGSTYEDSAHTEGSVCESDTALCRQSEEHGLADTLTVAKRVAGDAIDEAISKAEIQTDNQAKQNEANYLREHRGELVEELANTIVQKIIRRRKALAEMRPGLGQECPQNSSQDSLTHQPKIWRSQSAFSLLDNDVPELNPPLGLKNEGGGSSMSAWQSVDRLLDNSVLKSPDGNWITLQSGQLSRPSLLTRRKSLVFSALEQESGLVSAYRALDSEPETPPEYCGSWGAVLRDLHRKMTGGGDLDLPDFGGEPPRSSVDGEGGGPRQRRPSLAFLKRQLPLEVRRPSSSRRTSVIDVNFSPEGTVAAAAAAAAAGAGGESSRGESSGGEALKDSSHVRRSRRRRSKKERGSSSSTLLRCRPNRQNANNGSPARNSTSQHASPDTLTSEAATPDPLDLEGGVHRGAGGGGVVGEELAHRLQQLARRGSLSDASVAGGDDDDDGLHPGELEEKQSGDGGEVPPEECGRSGREGEEDGTYRRGGDEPRQEEEEEAGEEGKTEYHLRRFAAQAGAAEPSSAHPELSDAGQSEGGWKPAGGEGEQEEEEEVVFRLLHLESQVRATQFSSTEDELDRVGRGARGEELAARLRRLAEQVSGGELSSTDEELEGAGPGGGSRGSPEKGAFLWRAEAEEVRDLANLVSASQFSSTEDELDRAGEGGGEGGGGRGVGVRGGEWRVEREGLSAESRGSTAHFSEGMFDFLDAQEAESISKAVEEAAQALEGRETAERGRDKEGDPAGPAPVRRQHGEESTPEGTAHPDRSEEEGERGSFSLSGGLTPAHAPDEQEREDGEECGLQTEETERRTCKDPTATVLSDGDISCDELELDKAEKQVLRALDLRQAETETETMQQEDAESDRIAGAAGEEGVWDRDHLEGETDALSREGGGEHEGHRHDPGRGKGRAAEDGTADQGGSEDQGATDGGGQAGDVGPEVEASLLCPEEIQSRYSAVSLCSLTTEMLMVLNATEDLLLQGVVGGADPAAASAPQLLLSPDTDPRKLDQQFSRLEESVYVAAGTAFGLESELGDLEECARAVGGDTPDAELSFLEEQVASAAAKVQQSELQVSNISARIAALKSAGLNVDSHSRVTQDKTVPTTPRAVPSSRHAWRRLPAAPGEGKEA